MSSVVALPWILTAGGAAAGLGALLLVRAWADHSARARAEADMRTLEAGDRVLRSLQTIVVEGETLLQLASIRAVSPELIEAVGEFRLRAEAALRHAERQPRPDDEALRQLGLDAGELLRAADVTVKAVVRLHAGAAGYEPTELMHGEARHASARLSELAAKMADARARIAAHRKMLMPLVTHRPLPFALTMGWRPQASK